MATIVVDVMPKAELLDPQGKAVAGALARLGKGEFTSVRVGKRFEITTGGPPDAATLAAVQEIADDILSNSVIEDVVGIRVLTEDVLNEDVLTAEALTEKNSAAASTSAGRHVGDAPEGIH